MDLFPGRLIRGQFGDSEDLYRDTDRIVFLDPLFTSVADPGFGIRCLFDPWIRDGLGKKSISGFGMNIPDYISESLKTIFWVNT
jgi:hypothetical protein